MINRHQKRVRLIAILLVLSMIGALGLVLVASNSGT